MHCKWWIRFWSGFTFICCQWIRFWFRFAFVVCRHYFYFLAIYFWWDAFNACHSWCFHCMFGYMLTFCCIKCTFLPVRCSYKGLSVFYFSLPGTACSVIQLTNFSMFPTEDVIKDLTKERVPGCVLLCFTWGTISRIVTTSSSCTLSSHQDYSESCPFKPRESLWLIHESVICKSESWDSLSKSGSPCKFTLAVFSCCTDTLIVACYALDTRQFLRGLRETRQVTRPPSSPLLSV